MTDYLVAGSHPDTLASGRPIAPGDTVPQADVDLSDPHDAALVADGVLIDVQADRAAAEAVEAENPVSAPDEPSTDDPTTGRSGDAPDGGKTPQPPVKQATSRDSAAQSASSGPDTPKES